MVNATVSSVTEVCTELDSILDSISSQHRREIIDFARSLEIERTEEQLLGHWGEVFL